MRVGLSVSSQIPGLTGPELIAGIAERAAAAHAAGLSSLHVGDKHGTAGSYAANIVLAGRLSAHWDRPLGVLVVSSMWNPVLLAEQLATLAAASADGLTVVVALGAGPEHFASVGVPSADRLALFLEGLVVTQALLGGETVTARVGPYSIRDARVGLAGGNRVTWLVAASAPKAIARAARIAHGWLASAKLTPAQARDALATYRDAAGGEGQAVIRREVYVGVDEADVVARAGRFLADGYHRYPADALVAGTGEQVGEELREVEGWGFDELLARSLVNEQGPALGSIERLGDATLDLKAT